MLEIKFKPCCDNCIHRKTYTKENKQLLYGMFGVIDGDINTVIGCEHECVCFVLIEEIKKEQ